LTRRISKPFLNALRLSLFFRIRIPTIAFCGLILFLASIANSQTSTDPPARIRLNDPAVDGSCLKPYKNVWKIVYSFPGKEPFLVGTWSDELVAIELNGRHLMKRTQVADYAKYHVVTTNINVFDPKNMAPVYDEFKQSGGELVRRNFDNSSVTVQRLKADASTPEVKRLKLSEPVFDYYGGMYAVLLAAFPLREGYAATLPAIAENRDELEMVTFTVRKEELVDAGPGNQVMAWPVDLDQPDHDHLIFWITKEPPYVIKLINIKPSAKWITITISMM